ncbi:MAG: 2-oxoglutarate dehydrogenase complex dihydrolipoyllysine-residue succinyltransferase [Pirellulaceae bacterium]|nr:2-oxoglutarate dehydrogenase complex dihydrolipoyllysine-residue succinyltransferase [Pirellulaceae bacterium]
MSIELKAPVVGESVTEVQIVQWLKKEGEWAAKDEELVEIETEKASVPVIAPAGGRITKIVKQEGEFVEVNDLIALFEESEESAAAVAGVTAEELTGGATGGGGVESGGATHVMPAAEGLLVEYGLKSSEVPATGPGGRLLKEDVQNYVASKSLKPTAVENTTNGVATKSSSAPTETSAAPTSVATTVPASSNRVETVKPMSMLRRTIATRLVEAQQTAALLTTFNEINMSPVMTLRKKYKDAFHERHGVKLGFMSFFTKAAAEALRKYPAINSEVREKEVISRNYCDIGIAIGGGKGLVVPILRNAEAMSFAEIEKSILDYAIKAKENKIKPADIAGGTFTISNGGVYGSLLSTPIVNPPQSGILGLHSIQERPVAENGQVVVRPMMYVALTYDHRIVDGREAVGFLITIKNVIEDPTRLFLEV